MTGKRPFKTLQDTHPERFHRDKAWADFNWLTQVRNSEYSRWFGDAAAIARFNAQPQVIKDAVMQYYEAIEMQRLRALRGCSNMRNRG